MIRCAVYARYSSDLQRPESIQDQIRHCRQEAERHTDWRILDDHIYTDEAMSGVSTEGRTGLSRLVTAARESPRAFDLVLVDDTSRLARDVVDAVRLLRELRFHGVHLYFVNQGLHTARDNADFFVAIYGATDSEYIRELGKKTHRGLEGQVRRGLSAGGLAYGYHREPIYEPSGGNRDEGRRVGVRWVIDPGQARIVGEIFQWYADGRGMATIASALNERATPSPRQAKRHQLRHDSVGAGWDVSTVRVILTNELYRGHIVWNRSRWVREPGTRRRRRIQRPPSEWIILDRPELRIVNEELWQRVQSRRARIRAHYDTPQQFGKGRAEYGSYLLSGLLVCGECGGVFTIRTGSRERRDQRYGCSRHWRRGSHACPNAQLVRRVLAEQHIVTLLQEKLYQLEAVQRLVEKVNARLRARGPHRAAERASLLRQRAVIERRLEGLRRFIERGDTSGKVREWLTLAEQEGQRIEHRLAELETQVRQAPLQVHPAQVEPYLKELDQTLQKAGPRTRDLLHADVERIIVHQACTETGKPFARAEVVTTGKGLLGRVAFMVAGAGFEPATFGL